MKKVGGEMVLFCLLTLSVPHPTPPRIFPTVLAIVSRAALPRDDGVSTIYRDLFLGGRAISSSLIISTQALAWS